MRLIVALLLVTAVWAGRADAQPAPWQAERTTPGWTFLPSVVFGGRWDSNVTVRNEGSPEVQEWVGLLNPRGEIDYNGRHTRFSSGYSGTLQAYDTLDELNRYDQRGRLYLRRQVTPRLALDTRHSITATPTTEELEIAGLPFARVGSQMYTGRGGATYALSERTGLSTEYMFQWVDFDSDSVDFTQLSGGQSHTGGIALTHRLSRRLSAGGTWEYALASLTRSDRTAHIQRALGTVGWQLGPATSVSGGAGVSHVRVPNTDVSMIGPAFGARIEHHVGRVQLSARYDQSFVATYAFGSAMSTRTIGGFAYVPLLRGRMFVSGSGTLRHTEPAEGITDLITLDSLVAQTTVGYHIARWLRMEAFYNGSFQESSARGTYDRTRIGLQFVTSKPVRIE